MFSPMREQAKPSIPQEGEPAKPPAQTIAEAETPRWEQLTAAEKIKLRDKLSNRPAHSLTVYCVNSDCVDLGADLVEAFAQAGWQVTQRNGGGIGIDGLTRIRITACNGLAKELKETIESTTNLKNIEAIEDAKCAGTALIIGIKPF